MTESAIVSPQPRPGDRVVVGMSGGVDSSVAAALLVEAGYDVVGISMRLWGDASGSGCCSLDDFLDARRVAARLGVPFYVMDFQDEFARAVVQPFVGEYLKGRTPNPCIRCNQLVKFAPFWDRARELGAQWVATGHYARVRRQANEAQLLAAVDGAKDQSYYLFAISRQVLAHTLFPVGELTKEEVRARACGLGLPVAQKPDSQEICFVPKGGHAAFVERHAGTIAAHPGLIVGDDGQVLGRHGGVHQFTIGQRRGLRIETGGPMYVTEIDSSTHTVRVGPRQATVAGGLVARDAHWLCGTAPEPGKELKMKIRSRFSPARVILGEATAEHFVAWAPEGLSAVTPGQAAVLYDNERVLGGGWIERALRSPE
jgi:tRNA-specific 2-thiouridylase